MNRTEAEALLAAGDAGAEGREAGPPGQLSQSHVAVAAAEEEEEEVEMSALRDEVEERLRPLPVGDGLLRLPPSEEARDVVDLLVGELESLRAELEAVRSRRLARCPVCAGACTRKYADDSWDPCDHCNGAGVIFVDKEVKS